ncbi:alpha-N-acetylglucosaminidase [Streptomyces sp. TRM 70351]|uniref:alpha-N-acetylglucosaminidase n=1 Tax=Streptomyces sp. TRM 70351 TaxID=3116552 RepID=UPI002E7C093E|nr:alpha-N-acetylglucosaminidase [Streptomyces sp. TRM 70351]MEE1931397.1 alpha-N-acetylglucosaminidase [Streptomyces sp. TRM 70351]
MSGLSRRAVLGSAGALGAGAALTAGAPGPAGGTGGPRGGGGGGGGGGAGRFDTGPARDAIARLLPGHTGQFTLTALTGAERFTVDGRAGQVALGGTSPAALLTGLHWYLKYTCRAHVSWAGTQLDLPAELPAPGAAYERRATVPHRFALNDTHDGYTAPYADWARWERLIDVAALHGVNEVLVTPGTEAVYHRLLTDFGYTDAEARGWIPAPTHQPWWLLQNMSSYGGPVSAELLARRTELGQRITRRLRELGMSPVLPGYFGTVPRGFAGRNPGARTVPQGTWAGLERPDWLDPRTTAFREVAARFYAHQDALFGRTAHVKMDLLHEGGDPGDVPVPEAARAVENALQTARPGATWVILGWQANPGRELLGGLAHKDRVLVVDGLSDLERVTDREADFAGVPYAFGTIPNFGGRTTLGARTHRWTQRFPAWRDRPGSTLAGTAFMPEAAERDPAAFELFSELAWREETVDRTAWFAEYAAFRYGAPDPAAERAFAALRETAYRIDTADGRPHDSVFAARPSLDARSGTHYATHSPAYDPAAFDTAFAALLEVAAPLRTSDAYRYDVTDAARQAVANRSWLLIGQLQRAYEAEDAAAFGKLATLWLELMRLADDVAGGHRLFLLGPWLADARRSGRDAAQRAHLERTARVLITTWADRPTADGGRLAGYANRDWHGLIADVYLPRWKLYLDELRDALAAGRAPQRFDWYARTEPWTRQTSEYPQRAVGDPYRTAARARDVLARAPYQGGVTVTAEPPTLRPGGFVRLEAAFRNENGLRATSAVDLTLTGLAGAEPTGPVTLPPVAPGGRGTAVWRVTEPGGPPRAPLEPRPYELAAVFGPEGEPRVRTVRRGTLFAAGPLDAALRTHSTNGAVFGQLGDRFAIDGGGTDLWRAREEFGTVYRPGVLRDGAVVTCTVSGQPRTGPWARAGLVARADLARPGAPGFVNLAVTPDHGVVLSYDADGDGALDAYRRVTGVSAPVRLRLARSGTAFTGALSTDGGATWRTVATVRVPGARGPLDAGLFMTAAHGGSGARATVEFTGWTTG